jgi:signal transduction histidine kinase
MRALRPAWAAGPSLAKRLALGFALSFLALAVVVAAFQSLVATRFGALVTRMSLQGQAEGVFDEMRFDTQGQLIGLELDEGEGFGFDAYRANLKYRVLSAQGAVLLSNEPGGQSLLPHVPLAQQDGHYELLSQQGVRLHVVAQSQAVRGEALTVQLARSDGFEQLARAAITPAVAETTLLLGALAAIVFAAVGALAVRQALRPVREAAEAARAIDGSQLGARLPLAGMPAELLPLTKALNDALDRLECAFVAQQRFIADAAHELKTPLALLRMQAERPGGPQLQVVHTQIDAMARRVQQLLLLAEATDGLPLRIHPGVEPLALARQSMAQLAWKAEQAQVGLRLAHPEAAFALRADEGALLTLLKNLLENAIEFSPPGGEVLLTLNAQALRVQDEGPGVAPEHQAQLFQRFWRAPGQTRSGAGLGLALCWQIAQRHGWQIRYLPGAAQGANFELRWSLQPETSAPAGSTQAFAAPASAAATTDPRA